MDEVHRRSAEAIRSLLSSARATPPVVRAALASVPPAARDAWVDCVLGVDPLVGDGPSLPRGCVPYMPCPVDALLSVVEHAEIQASDVFVDVGSGVGRSAALVHLLTGAAAIGIEIQPELVLASRELTSRFGSLRLSTLEGDAVRLAGSITRASVFFLYCPFGGERVERILDEIEPIADMRPIRICCVNLPIPARPWLAPLAGARGDVAIYRSTVLDDSGRSTGARR